MIKILENNRFFTISITGLIAITIFILSSIPGTATQGLGIRGLSIIYHFMIFFLFNLFLLISIIGKRKIKSKYIIISILVSFVYAILDEIHQLFTIFRNASIGDVITDLFGILFSTIIYLYLKKIKQF